jgi:hypothetical protein
MGITNSIFRMISVGIVFDNKPLCAKYSKQLGCQSHLPAKGAFVRRAGSGLSLCVDAVSGKTLLSPFMVVSKL